MSYTFKELTAIPRRDLTTDFENEKGLYVRVDFDVWYRPVPFNHVAGAPLPEGWTPAVRIGSFTFEPMPGCCGVVVSTGSLIEAQFRNSHEPYRFHDLKEHVARELGYSCMLATAHTSNFPEIIGAAKHGWKMHPAFTNKRTKNQLTVMEKHL